LDHGNARYWNVPDFSIVQELDGRAVLILVGDRQGVTGLHSLEKKNRSSTDWSVRNRTLTLIEREDDTRSWENFLIYFSHSTTMPCPPRG
jgi:hypothetical protein